MAISDEITNLQNLHAAGSLTDAEFAAAKAKLLEGAKPPPPPETPEQREAKAAKKEADTRQIATFIHISMLAGFVVPMAGLALPIVLWQMKKDELPGVDEHGKNAVNWIISSIIYMVVSVVLILVVVGIVTLIILGILGIIFPIIAGVKASKGEVWRYPLSIQFIK